MYDPEKGFLGIDGMLTENSFLFNPDGRISGDFAFYTWFKGPHAGDFVLSLGGYHPKFNIPTHYPKPARIQFGFDMGLVRFKGQLYAALTSSAIMAGGRFEAFYGVENISAQFNVSLDFIISWLPFFYDARFSVSVSIRVDLWIDLKATIGTDLHIWGPEFAGYAKVNLKIYTAQFDFGAIDNLKKLLLLGMNLTVLSYLSKLIFLNTPITQGLISEQKDNNDVLWHIVEPDQFELKIESQLPVNT